MSGTNVWCRDGACVIRFYNTRKHLTDYIVLVATDLTLSAEWIVRHYEERPEIEQDYQQMKSGGWQLPQAFLDALHGGDLVCALGGLSLQPLPVVCQYTGWESVCQ